MSNINLATLLASSVISAILGGLISGFVTLRVARNQYVNGYYRTVVQRRLAAYEQLERLITMLKTSIVDDTDNRIYHIFFLDGDQLMAFKTLFALSSQSMWLSDEVVEETIKLNRVLFSFPVEQSGILEFAKQNYKVIAEIRTRLERLHSRDLLTLHQVPQFLKRKKPKDSYGQLPKKAG